MSPAVLAGMVAFTFLGGITPAEPWGPDDPQLNLYEIWNELYDTDYTTNADLDEYRIERARIFSITGRGARAEARARFHDEVPEFGYYLIDAEGELQKEILFEEVDAYGILPRDEYAETFRARRSIGFYSSPHEALEWFTEPALQEPFGYEDELHVLIYEAPNGKLLLAWEADPFDESNRDYNDLVVEVDLREGVAFLGRGAGWGLLIPGLTAGAAVSSSGGDNGYRLWPLAFAFRYYRESIDPPSPPNPPQVVPEPETYALLLMGFAMLAWVGWRRRRKKQTD